MFKEEKEVVKQKHQEKVIKEKKKRGPYRKTYEKYTQQKTKKYMKSICLNTDKWNMFSDEDNEKLLSLIKVHGFHSE